MRTVQQHQQHLMITTAPQVSFYPGRRCCIPILTNSPVASYRLDGHDDNSQNVNNSTSNPGQRVTMEHDINFISDFRLKIVFMPIIVIGVRGFMSISTGHNQDYFTVNVNCKWNKWINEASYGIVWMGGSFRCFVCVWRMARRVGAGTIISARICEK